MIPPSPAVVSVGLATAALQCPALDSARRLAEWVGAGKELTASGVPKPAAAIEACAVLGIELPGPRLRSALDVDELMVAWVAALRAGFLLHNGRQVMMAPAAAALGQDGTRAHPRAVLVSWLAAVAAEFGVPEDPCSGCLTVLHELQEAGRPVGLGELADALVVPPLEPVFGGPCPDCGVVHLPAGLLDGPAFPDGSGFPGDGSLLDDAGFFDGDDLLDDGMPDEMDGLEHVGGAVAGLLAFGAAELSGDLVSLTPLGAMLATSVFEGCAPAPDADAQGLVTVLGELPPTISMIMAKPWLAVRSAEAGVRELLTFAESACGTERVTALAVARTVGPEPVAAWRQWAGKPGFGAYARQWLAEHGKPVAVHSEDEAWLVVDAFSTMLESLDEMGPPMSLAMAFQELGENADDVLSLLRESGHPAADQVAARLDEQVFAPAVPAIRIISPGEPWPEPEPPSWPPADTGAKSATVYQLKISLRYVADPPVWRRVLVPGAFTLGNLHDVIQLVMGWDFSHLHVFSTRVGEYGRSGPELEYGDQHSVLLTDVLPKKRSKLLYTYDFGDDWEHDVVVEDRRPLAKDDVLPCCVAGEGACPPEDCGGPWSYGALKEILADPAHEEHVNHLEWMGLDKPGDFDAAAFSLDDVNKRLGPRG